MRYGDKADWFAALEADGAELPEDVTEPPELFPDLIPDWTAFVALSGSRPLGFSGAGRIPISEVVAYCDLMGIVDVECRAILLRRIQILDDEFLKIQAEKQKS